jgi:DNA repair protein RecN (Recombination protein N)
MLVHLSVHNYAIVEHLDLELDRGMSVITGETGAGKSIMLDALGLTLGDRADSGVVRPGADKADILATFDLQAIPEAQAWLAERDLENDGPVHSAPRHYQRRSFSRLYQRHTLPPRRSQSPWRVVDRHS